MTPDDASRQLQRGVLTALMHIASVREAGAAPLAIEFSAVLEEVKRAISDASTPDEIRQSFECGLPLPLLKVLAESHVAGDRRLRGLEPDELGLLDRDCRARYGALVIAAAEAAMKVQIDKSAWRRRYTARWELSALDDIRKLVQPDA
jgi:hypothetical protein